MSYDEAVPLESLTEKSNIRTILDSIYKATDTMMNEYALDGKIGDNIFSNRDQAWDYARHETLKTAREKTGRKLPEN